MASSNAFKRLGLNKDLVKSIEQLGFEHPTEVQQQSIPVLLKGCDLIALAQTGTGKTAAFALPILQSFDEACGSPQALIITPTRELSIQVADAIRTFSKHLKQLTITTLYGGQDYRTQLRQLKSGADIVVGTPGRIMDHMRRGTLQLDQLKTLVLDEADEMLRMGFIEDIEWVLSHVEHDHQTALFSATMPSAIQRVAKRFLQKPAQVHVQPNNATVEAIDQCYMMVKRKHKTEALARYLEVEQPDACIVFTATKTMSADVADRLNERGYNAAALNGDMSQALREQVLTKLKQGHIDIIVATEVAARGIDVKRLSHVINFDIPRSAESYVHRIGRTGRAGKSGKALMLVIPSEQRLLTQIARHVDFQLVEVEPPSIDVVKKGRDQRILDQLVSALDHHSTGNNQHIIDLALQMRDTDANNIASAALHLLYKQQYQSLSELPNLSGEMEHERSPRHKARPAAGKKRRNRHPAERRKAKRSRKKQ